MPPFHSEQFVVALDVPHCRKVFQICFSRKDGSVLVNFPYFRHTIGLASVATIPAGEGTQNVSLEPAGKITSHLVKYSHHPDGRAHFSQDTKVFTKIKKRSVPLDAAAGQLCAIMVQGFDAFDEMTSIDMVTPPSRKRTVLKFKIEGQAPQALKFVIWCYQTSELRRRNGGRDVDPIATLVNSTPAPTRPAYLCSAPLGRAGQHRCVVVSCEGLPTTNVRLPEQLLFYGGFDNGPGASDPSVAAQFLALLYPVENAEALRERLGSIDLTEPTNDATIV